jgi:hypothetical protein
MNATELGLPTRGSQSDSAALRINLNIQGCGVVAPPMHAPSRASPSSPPPSFTQSPSPPRSLVRDGQTGQHKPRLVVSRITCPPLSPSPQANSFVTCTAVINKHTPRPTPPTHRPPFRASSSVEYFNTPPRTHKNHSFVKRMARRRRRIYS